METILNNQQKLSFLYFRIQVDQICHNSPQPLTPNLSSSCCHRYDMLFKTNDMDDATNKTTFAPLRRIAVMCFVFMSLQLIVV